MGSARSNTNSVVVPADQGPHSIECLRSLGRRGIHTISPYERQTPVFSSRYCDEPIIVPSPESDVVSYKDTLLSLARRDDTRAIIPMREADIYVLSRYRSEFAEAVTPLWPEFETLKTVHDRVRLTEAARTAGVSVPETASLGEVDEWSSQQVVKPRYALLATDYVDLDRPKQVIEPNFVQFLDAGTEPDRELILEEKNHEPIVQEFVPGDEYAFWAFYEHGEPIATCLKHQIRGKSYTGGTSVYRKTTHVPALESAGRTLLDHLDWHGFASVQFKKDARTGEFTLLEINPRVWVSIACPVKAGFDFPYYYWQLANGKPVTVPEDYRKGFGTHRLGGEVVYLWSVLQTEDTFIEPPRFRTAAREVSSSLLTQPHFDYLAMDDPLPFVRDTVNHAVSRIELLQEAGISESLRRGLQRHRRAGGKFRHYCERLERKQKRLGQQHDLHGVK